VFVPILLASARVKILIHTHENPTDSALAYQADAGSGCTRLEAVPNGWQMRRIEADEKDRGGWGVERQPEAPITLFLIP
jgi:hypothetical protein